MHLYESVASLFGQQCTREPSASPPPAFNPPAYSYEEHSFYAVTYPPHNLYHEQASPYAEHLFQQPYFQPTPFPMPSMLPSHDGVKQEAFLSSGVEFQTPFGMNFASLNGIDQHTSQSYSEASAHVNPTTFLASTPFP